MIHLRIARTMALQTLCTTSRARKGDALAEPTAAAVVPARRLSAIGACAIVVRRAFFSFSSDALRHAREALWR
jgi:hypothetical protein